VPGILNFLNDKETSQVSICSISHLLSKLMDFQKNMFADNFIRELAKIEPDHLRSYGLEKVLLRKNSQSYKQSIFSIIIAYVEKRKA
jgi:hypothetical protein